MNPSGTRRLCIVCGAFAEPRPGILSNPKGPPYDLPRRPLGCIPNPKGPPYGLPRRPFRSTLNREGPPYGPPKRPLGSQPNGKGPPYDLLGHPIRKSNELVIPNVSFSVGPPAPPASRGSRRETVRNLWGAEGGRPAYYAQPVRSARVHGRKLLTTGAQPAGSAWIYGRRLLRASF